MIFEFTHIFWLFKRLKMNQLTAITSDTVEDKKPLQLKKNVWKAFEQSHVARFATV